MKRLKEHSTSLLMTSLLVACTSLSAQGMGGGRGPGQLPGGGAPEPGTLQRPGQPPVENADRVPDEQSNQAPADQAVQGPNRNETPDPTGQLGQASILGLDDQLEVLFQQFDLNADGIVTLREIERAQEAGITGRAASFMAERDFNQDGLVSLDELVMQAVDVAAANRAELLAPFDLNDDGTITPEESLMVHQKQAEKQISRLIAALTSRVPVETRDVRPNRTNRRQDQDERNSRGNRNGRNARDSETNQDRSVGQNKRENQNDQDRTRNGRNQSPLSLDIDDDGAFSKNEIMTSVIDRIGQLQDQFHERFDNNNDGTISQAEIAAVDITGIFENAFALIARLDQNRDAHLSLNEVRFQRESPDEAPSQGNQQDQRPNASDGLGRPSVDEDQPDNTAPNRTQRRPTNGRGRR